MFIFFRREKSKQTNPIRNDKLNKRRRRKIWFERKSKVKKCVCVLIILRKINYLLECYERCSFYQINKIKKYFYLFEFFKEINKKVFNSQYEDYLETTEVTLNEFFINVVEGKFLSNENFMLVDKIKNTGKKCLLDDQKNLRLFIEKFSKQVINIF